MDINICKNVLNSSFEDVDKGVVKAISKYKKVIDLYNPNINKENIKIYFVEVDYVLRELLNNAVEHGNSFDDAKKVYFRMDIEDGYLKIEVSDQGDGFRIDNEINLSDDNLSERTRGLKSLVSMGYTLGVTETTVTCKKKIALDGNNLEMGGS